LKVPPEQYAIHANGVQKGLRPDWFTVPPARRGSSVKAGERGNFEDLLAERSQSELGVPFPAPGKEVLGFAVPVKGNWPSYQQRKVAPVVLHLAR